MTDLDLAAIAVALLFCTAIALQALLLKRPRPHFSLRTLLIITTLLAVMLGAIVWAAK